MGVRGMAHMGARGCLMVAAASLAPSLAQAQPASPAASEPEDATLRLDALTVTGSRIARSAQAGESPVLTISADELARSGLRSLGDALQRLPISGSALNTRFNEAGGQGFPPDGGGFGAGSTTLSLRHLGNTRVLVLVDGRRWVNESSGSGVSGAVDLGTIPLGAIERIEVLTDGASAIYGSDAIAGVVNVITRRATDGGRLTLYGGDRTVGDGATGRADLTLGSQQDRLGVLFNLSHFEQRSVRSSAFAQSSVPVPGTGLANGSSATPTGRFIFSPPDPDDTAGGLCPQQDTDGDGDPDAASCNVTPNGAAPGGVPSFPGDFHSFDGGVDGDRYNFAPENLLLTPNERTGLFTRLDYQLTEAVALDLTGFYQARSSQTRSAPEPIFIGPGAGSGGLADRVGIDASNPFNPLGYSLDAASNLAFAARRPVEGGPRIFSQAVDTRHIAATLSGGFTAAQRYARWDVSIVNARNSAGQTVQGTYNIARIGRALGPVDACVAPCVPLNFFGGPGSITPEQLAYIQFTENDRSTQALDAYTANLSSALFELPAGRVGFATGLERRRLAGSYSPDAVVIGGESNGVPSLPTSGSYTVDEWYAEVRVPLLLEQPWAHALDLHLATR